MQYIIDATPENFKELVIGNSMRGPVMVNYWSASAGPCLLLWPRLESLANEMAGKFLLVNLNTDKYRSFVQNELGVRSVPTLQIYFNQQVVDVVHGAESEQSIRNLLLRHLPRSSDSQLLESVKLYNSQQPDEAIDALMRVHKADPENPRVSTSIIKLLFRESRFEDMHSFIEQQSSAVKNNEEVISLQTHAILQNEAEAVEDIEQLHRQLELDRENIPLRYQLAAVAAMNEELVESLDQLLEILRLDPGYRNKLPAKTMVLLINALGGQTDIARSYRARMMDVLSESA